MSQFSVDRVEADAGSEWSDADLKELGDMLLRGLSMEEISRRLCREKTEVRDKVAEVGRSCHSSADRKGFEAGKSDEWTAGRLRSYGAAPGAAGS